MRRVYVTTTLACPDCGAALCAEEPHQGLRGRSLPCTCGMRWAVADVQLEGRRLRVDLLGPVDEGGRWVERVWVRAAA